MMFRKFATDPRDPANFKRCESNAFDWLLHNLLTSLFWTVAMVPPMLVVTSAHADAPAQLLGPVELVRHDTKR